jgi:hypothetical protein
VVAKKPRPLGGTGRLASGLGRSAGGLGVGNISHKFEEFWQMFKKITYQQLKDHDLHKRNYNFQKLSAVLADYGFHCEHSGDDWHNAGFTACHLDGVSFLKIYLQTRLLFDKNYRGQVAYVACPDYDNNQWYLYPHDKILNQLIAKGIITGTKSWEEKGLYHFPSIPEKHKALLTPYQLGGSVLHV